jgi:hypothetical protein
MEYWLVLGAMILVATGLLALLLTSAQSVRDEKPQQRKAAVAMWLRILMAGWVFFLLLPFVPGGFDGAWAWIASQSVAMRAAMWLLLLPWMLDLGAWQLEVPAVLRVAAMLGIAVLTFYLGSLLIGPEQE